MMFKPNFRSVVIVSLLFVFVRPAVSAEQEKLSAAEETLVAAETERFNAQIARDIPKLKLTLADELVYTHAAGRVQNKDEYLQGFESGGARYQAIDVTGRAAHVYGEAGVITGTISLDIGIGRKLVSRYTGVYVKRGGRWQLVAWQATDIQPPPNK
jgi:hypothetical protein